MAKKKGQNQNKGNITKDRLVTMLPGMLMSAKLLILECEKGETEGLIPGIFAASVIMSAQCAELLLKYKIRQEGHTINWGSHDLHYLYQALNADSKAAIQAEYDQQLVSQESPDDWKSVESVFQKTANASVAWRYAVEPGNIRLIYPRGLYIAAASVYKIIPELRFLVASQEVTDPAERAEVLNYLKGQ